MVGDDTGGDTVAAYDHRVSKRDRKRAAKVAQEAAREAMEATLAYVDEHREVFGGQWYEGDGTDRRFVVAFIDDLQPHREALAAAGPGLRIVSAQFTEEELERVAEVAWDLATEFDAECVQAAGVDPIRNQVFLEAITDDGERLEALLAERFGERVVLEVTATEPWSPAEQGFDGWLIDRTGRAITVTFLGGAGERNYELSIEESAESVSIQVLLERFNGAVAAVGIQADVTGRLDEPLGTRTVIDAVAGEPLERGRRYGSVD